MFPKVCLPGPTRSRAYQIGSQDQPSQMSAQSVGGDGDVQNPLSITDAALHPEWVGQALGPWEWRSHIMVYF